MKHHLAALAGFAVIGLWVLWGTAAQAGPFVACVQAQLTDAGVDVGPVDGLLGAKTRRGLKALAQDHPSLADLPDLSTANAFVVGRATLFWGAGGDRIGAVCDAGREGGQPPSYGLPRGILGPKRGEVLMTFIRRHWVLSKSA